MIRARDRPGGSRKKAPGRAVRLGRRLLYPYKLYCYRYTSYSDVGLSRWSRVDQPVWFRYTYVGATNATGNQEPRGAPVEVPILKSCAVIYTSRRFPFSCAYPQKNIFPKDRFRIGIYSRLEGLACSVGNRYESKCCLDMR